MNIPFIPVQASTFASQVDAIFYAMVGLTIFFVTIISLMLATFVVRYRRGSNVDRSNPTEGNLILELTWSIIPMLMGLGIYVWSTRPYAEIYNPPANINTIDVIGKRWMWQIQHTRSGIRENDQLHLVVNQPVKFDLISQDVIHGFFIPAFRIKRDCLPGHYNTMWVTPNRVGKYYLYCSEYCGSGHSEMGGYVYVMSPEDYAVWKSTGQNRQTEASESAVEIGQGVFQKFGCANCHGRVNGVHAPTLYGLYGTQASLTNGTSPLVDANFIRNELINPNGLVVKGWPAVMPSYPIGSDEGDISESNLLDLIQYIKSLRGGAGVPGETVTAVSASQPVKQTKVERAVTVNGKLSKGSSTQNGGTGKGLVK